MSSATRTEYSHVTSPAWSAPGVARPRRPATSPNVVALLDPDRALNLSVTQSLAALGLVVERHSSVDEVLDASSIDPPAFVLVATASSTRRARTFTRALRASDDAPPVAWWCAGPISQVPQRVDERPEAMLFGHGDIDAVSGMVWRATRQPLIRDGWSGDDFLGRLRGDMVRYPPFRLLFLAHRLGATGDLAVERGGRRTVISLRSGTVVDVRGAPDLMGVGGAPRGSGDDLAAVVGRAIAAGARPDVALDQAATGVGRLLAGLLEADDGVVSFSAVSPVSAVPLPMAVPRMLALGLAHQRRSETVERMLGPLWQDRVVTTFPNGAQLDRWGLDALSLGLLRKAELGCSLDDLVGRPRRPEVLQTVDLLLALGLVRLNASVPRPAPVDRSSSARVATPPRPSPLVERTAGPRTEASAGKPQMGFRFEARFLGLLALAREGTTDMRSLVPRFAELEYPSGLRGADAAFEVAEMVLAAGHVEAAVDFYQRVLSRAPDHEGARRRMRSRRLRVSTMSGGAGSRSPSGSHSGSLDGDATLGDMIDGWIERWRA